MVLKKSYSRHSVLTDNWPWHGTTHHSPAQISPLLMTNNELEIVDWDHLNFLWLLINSTLLSSSISELISCYLYLFSVSFNSSTTPFLHWWRNSGKLNNNNETTWMSTFWAASKRILFFLTIFGVGCRTF